MSKLVWKTTKPKVQIKTVKGHRYLQLIDIHGNLIHIGSTDKVENWSVAYRALRHQYDALGFHELTDLDSNMGLLGFKNEAKLSVDWDKFRKKRIKARIRGKFTYRAIVHDLHPEEEPNLVQEIESERERLEIEDEASNVYDLSPELAELYKIVNTEQK